MQVKKLKPSCQIAVAVFQNIALADSHDRILLIKHHSFLQGIQPSAGKLIIAVSSDGHQHLRSRCGRVRGNHCGTAFMQRIDRLRHAILADLPQGKASDGSHQGNQQDQNGFPHQDFSFGKPIFPVHPGEQKGRAVYQQEHHRGVGVGQEHC